MNPKMTQPTVPVSKSTSMGRQWFTLMLLLLCLLTSPRMHAQLTVGHIAGNIRDSSGAALPNATITLTSEGTGAVTTTTSTGTGTYTFELVNPGLYTLRIEAQGFAPQITHGVDVHIQQTVTQDYTLGVGDVNQQVTVTTSTPLLQAEDAAVGQTVDSKAINDLPLVGRDWTTLAHLAAGTTTAGTNGTAAGLTFSANGVNSNQNDIRLDGIDDNMEFYGSIGTISIQATTTIVPPPDAIQEFRLQSGDLSAAFGHSTGSVINAVVKSGSNQYHGDLWEYIRNDALNANDYFTKQRGQARPRYHENQYGGTTGGPVRIPETSVGLKNTFFFFDAQRISIISPRASTATVPTASMQSSGFTNMQDLITYNSGTRTDGLGRIFSIGTILDPTTTRQVAAGAVDSISGLQNKGSAAVYVRDPFYNGGSVAGITSFAGMTNRLNNIPASRIDANAVKLLNIYPLPTSAGFLNDFYYTPTINLTLNQYDVRIDHNINSSNLLWGVFNWYHASQATPGNLPGLALGANYGAGLNDSPHYALAVSYTHIFTPTLSNSLNFGMQNSKDTNLPPSGNTAGIPAQFGIQGITGGPGLGGLPTIALSNMTSLGAAGYNPVDKNVRSVEVLDTLTKSFRNHTFSLGYELTRITASIRQPTSGLGAVTFNGSFSDIPSNASGYTSMADLLLTPMKSSVAGGLDYQGGASLFRESNVATINNYRWYNAVYFQDDWKALPNLTLNLGLRYDHYGPPIDPTDRQANLIAGGAGNGPTGTFFMPTSTCNQAPPQFLALLAKDGIQQSCTSNRGLSNVQKFNFAPRVGFAYRIRPDFVIRAGYGIAYGALANIGAAPYVIGNNFPFAYSLTYTAPSPVTPITLATGLPPTIENVFASINLSSPANVNPFGANLAGRQYSFQTPYTQTYNLTIQKQVGTHDSVQAAYVGNVGRHLDSRGTFNVPSIILPPGTNNFNYVPFPDFAIGSAYLATTAVSSYNSLQTVYTHQFSGGLSVLANYTYSKCMTDQGAISDGITPRAQFLAGFGISSDYTLCPNDAKHVIHAAGSYDLPVGHGRQLLSSSNAITQAALGGWGTNYIVTYQSGQPFNIPCPIATTSYFGCNAFKVAGVDPAAGAHTQLQWVNPKAFSNPARATQIGQTDYSVLGGLSNQARGPAFTNVDASVFKEFPVKEAVHFQFRAEAYNLFNHTQFGNPTSNLDFTNVTTFSRITALRNQARVMQLALKLLF